MGSFDLLATLSPAAPYLAVHGDLSALNNDTAARREVVVVDATVADWQTLVAGISPDTPLLVLHPDTNGMGEVELLAAFLAQHQNLDAIHLVTEGRSGALLLGSEALYAGNLQAASPYLAQIGSALKPGGDVMLYGCSVAYGEAGQKFIDDLAGMLGDVDVSASTDKTGPTPLGGDWDLEYSTGEIETVLPFTLAGMQDISHCLGCTVGTTNVSYTYYQTHYYIPGGISGLEILSPTNTRVGVHGGVNNFYYLNTFLSGNGYATLAAFEAAYPTECSPANTAPTFTGGANTGLTVLEDASITTITTAKLQVIDAEQAASARTFTVGTAPTKGVLTNNGVTVNAASTFTQANIDSGLIKYIPNANSNGADSFTFSVADGAGGTLAGQTFSITITAVNDVPTVATNTGLTLNEGATATIANTTLSVSDVDNAAAQRTYTVGTATANGTLYKSGVAMSASSTFTQADIDNSLITYTHNGGETTSDSFTFTVSDGAGGSIGLTTFNLTVTPVNDAPTLTTASNLTGASEDTAYTINYADLQAAADEADVEGATLSFRVEAVSSGTLTKGGAAVVAGTTLLGTGESLVWTPAANASGTLGAFTVKAYDGALASSTAIAVNVEVAAVNDAPTIGGATAVTNINDTATATPFSAFTITDVETTQTQAVSVTLDTAAKGSFTTLNGFTDAGGGVYTFSGTAAAAQTAIRGLVFTPTANRVASGLTETTTFTVSVSDGIAAAATDATTTVVATSVNDAPTIGGASAGQAVNDNATVSPFTGITIGDADTPTQTQTVSVTLDTAAKGSFTTLNGFADAGGGVYTFSGTAAAATTAIRGLVFTPTANRVNPTLTETTTFTISTNDGVAAATTNNTTTVVSTSINDAPAVGGATAVTNINDTATATPFSTFTISDADTAQSQTLTVTLDTAAKGALSNLSGGTYTAGTGVYSFTGTAAQAQAAIRALVFTPTANRAAPAGTETTTFTMSINDGVAAAATDATTTVVSTSINDAPVLDAGQSPALSGLGINPAVPSNGSTTGSTLVSALVAGISDADTGAVKGIAVTAIDTVNGTLYYSTNGGATWTAAGAVAANSALLLASDANTRVYYQSNNAVSGNIASALTFRAWDQTSGAAASKVDTTTNGTTTAFSTATDTASIAIYPPPTIGSVLAGQAANDDTTVSPFASSTIANAGTGNNVTVTVTLDTQAKGSFTTLSGFTDNGNGSYTLTNVTAGAAQTAIRGLVFTPAANRVNPTLTETTTFTLTVTDVTTTVAVTDATTTVVSTSVNDAPAVGGVTAVTNINDTATATPFSAFTISDADTAQTQTLTVTLDTAAKGALSNLSGGAYNAGTGVYTFTGTAAQAQAAIQGLVFTPAANRVNPTLTETTTFTVSVNDAIAAAATDANTTVVATSLNDAPTVGGATAVTNLNVGVTASTSPFAAFTVTDADTAQTQAVTVTLDDAAKGALSNLSGGAYDAGTGVYTFTGTAAQAQAAIRALVFTPTASRVTAGATETTTFTASVNDGIAAAASDNTTTVVVTNVPPPVVVPPSPPPPAPTPADIPTGTFDGITITGSTQTTQSGTTTTTVTTVTVPIVSDIRQDDPNTVLNTHADIPLAQNDSGETVIQVSVPVGVGLTAQTITGSSSATSLTLRETLIAASDPKVDSGTPFEDVLQRGIDAYVPTVQDEAQVTVRTITLTVATGTTQAPDQPILITGASGTGESDAANPNRQEALIIDARALPSGSVLQLNNVEFAIVVGAVRVIGGDGRNFAVGDNAVQYMVLGEDDDVLRGGGGDDTIGSKGGDDQLFGDEGDDLVVGGLGDDILEGGDGDDILQGGSSDAGLWQVTRDAQGQTHLHFSASATALAETPTYSWINTYAYDINNVAFADSLDAFLHTDMDTLETIALLYQAVLGRLPDNMELNHWARQDLSSTQLAEVAYTAYTSLNNSRNLASSTETETQVRQLIEDLWGSASTEMVRIGSDYIAQGGSWAEGLLYLARHANHKMSLLDAQGHLPLMQALSLGETGWSAMAGNDQLYGGAGHDRLVGGNGNNILDGGSGIDMVVLTGNVAHDYALGLLETTPGTIDLVLKNVLTGDINILRNIEFGEIGGVIYGPQANMPSLVNGEYQMLADFVQIVGTTELQAMGVPVGWLG